MSYNLLKKEYTAGPLEIYGTAIPSPVVVELTNTTEIVGYFYPVFLNIEECILEDKDRGGPGHYIPISLYNVPGEFYMPSSFINVGKSKSSDLYKLYEGEGAENPFSKIKNNLSVLIDDQLPDFVREENIEFIRFLTVYYEFLESNNQAQEVLQNLTKYSDIDETSELLVDQFFKTYAETLTKSNIADNRFVVKKIKDLYAKKGTEESYRILFNILFRETVEFFYPYSVVLKPSDGKWVTQYSLKVKRVIENQNIFDFENTEIVGLVSGATASVNSVLKFNINEYEYYEFILDENTLTTNFIPGEQVTAIKSFSDELIILNLRAELYRVVSKITVKNPSAGYKIGHPITITDTTGRYARAEVSGVDRFGGIKAINIIDSGFEYSNFTTIDPGLPTESIDGTYELVDGKVTLSFPRQHGLVIGKNIQVNYTGNIFSPINNTSHDAVIVSVPTPRKIRFRYPGF